MPSHKAKPSVYLKWILLTPALFGIRPKSIDVIDQSIPGWLPGFVDAVTGKVRLRPIPNVERGSLPRKEWREKMNNAPEIKAKLVAARIPKYSVASGWKIGGDGQPKASRRLVPAGSVFYFECDNDENAKMLADVLHGRTHSDECGEQGFGFGVCGNWNNQI